MDFGGIFIILMIVFWLSDRLSRRKPAPSIDPWSSGISNEKLIGLYDSCDMLVFGRIENLERIGVERYVMGTRHELVEVHMSVRVERPRNLKSADVVLNSCYYVQPGDVAQERAAAGVYPETEDRVCLGLFFQSEKNGIFYLGSNNPFFRIDDFKWNPYTRRRWIDLVPADSRPVCDLTSPGSTVH